MWIGAFSRWREHELHHFGRVRFPQTGIALRGLHTSTSFDMPSFGGEVRIKRGPNSPLGCHRPTPARKMRCCQRWTSHHASAFSAAVVGAQSRVLCPKLCEARGAALAPPAATLCATCPREFTALCLELRFPLSFWLLRLLAANRSMPEKRSSAAASRGPHLPPRRSYAVPVRAVQSIAGTPP